MLRWIFGVLFFYVSCSTLDPGFYSKEIQKFEGNFSFQKKDQKATFKIQVYLNKNKPQIRVDALNSFGSTAFILLLDEKKYLAISPPLQKYAQGDLLTLQQAGLPSILNHSLWLRSVLLKSHSQDCLFENPKKTQDSRRQCQKSSWRISWKKGNFFKPESIMIESQKIRTQIQLWPRRNSENHDSIFNIQVPKQFQKVDSLSLNS